MSNNKRITGKLLNDRWNVGAKHALYHKDGEWYHKLRRFPGALFDSHGYVLFATKEEYQKSPFLSIGEELHVNPNIAAMPGYRQVIPHEGRQASDFNEPEETRKITTTTTRILRDTALSQEIKKLYENCCQICGHALPMTGDETYAEAHHIKPLGSPHDGPDIRENIICVCPNHHAQLDYGAIRLELAELSVAPAHSLGAEFVEYHNSEIYHQG